MRRLLFVACGFLSVFILPSAVSAQEFNHTITVYATVPEQRAIYLDQYGAIIKIAGNTSNNIQPKIYDASIREVQVSPDIQRQYDDFLRQHGGKLEASRIYNINPLKVDNSTQTQKISVNNRSLPINLSL